MLALSRYLGWSPSSAFNSSFLSMRSLGAACHGSSTWATHVGDQAESQVSAFGLACQPQLL